MTPLVRTVALCLAFVAVVLGLFVYSVTRPPVLDEEALRAQGVYLFDPPRELVPFELTRHDGASFTQASLEGHWSFLFFGFTHCPDACPTTMAALAQAQATLVARGETGFQGVLISVDPERDDAQTLARYVSAFSDDFVGVRGELAALGRFAEQVNAAFAKVPLPAGTADPGQAGYSVDHTANLVLINPRGHYQGFIKYPPQAATIVAAYESLTAHF